MESLEEVLNKSLVYLLKKYLYEFPNKSLKNCLKKPLEELMKESSKEFLMDYVDNSEGISGIFEGISEESPDKNIF